jgi:hypothetical protein
MRPYPEEVIRAIQGGVAAHFAPELRSTYSQAQFAFSMMLFTIAQRDYDTAVPDLLDANTSLRTILADAANALETVDRDDARSARAALAALPAAAGSLRLSELRKDNDALRDAVCKLVPLIEPADDVAELAALRPARAAIYAYLLEDARRRVVPILTV